MNIEIKDKVFKQIKKYCDLNKLNVDEYIESLIQKIVTANIYGEVPDFIKLSEIKKENKEEKKSKKEIENLKQKIESLEQEIELQNTTIYELQNRQPIEIIKEIIVEKEVIKTVDTVVKSVEQSIIPEFTQFISQTTIYNDEPQNRISNKPKRRKLN
jgi:hypothetical protein